MKKIVSLLFVIAVVITSCTGDQGPMGPPGRDGIDGADGEDGGIIASSAFQIEVDFTAANDYSIQEDYGFEVVTSDVTLVYIQWETIEGKPVWRLLPQSVDFTNGNLVYNFDFTQKDVRIFLEGTIDFATLDDEWTKSQLFRVVVVPADFVDSVDVSNFDQMIQSTNIKSFELK